MSQNCGENNSASAHSKHGEHDGLYHLVYAFGYAVLSLVVDFTFIWPESHLGALLFLAAAFSLLALYELRNVKTEWKIVAVGIPFIAALTGSVIVGPVPPAETEIHGWLEPTNEPLPADNSCVKGGDVQQRRPDGILFTLGKTGMWFQKKSGGKRPLLTVGACTLMSAEFETNSLIFNADIFDLNHELVAHIERNEFHLIPGKFAYADRPDRHTLVVHDKSGKVLISVYFRNPFAIDVTGTFVCDDGKEAKVEKTGELTMIGPKGSLTWDKGCLINTGGFVVSEWGFGIGPTPCWALNPNDNSAPTQYSLAICRARGEPTSGPETR